MVLTEYETVIGTGTAVIDGRPVELQVLYGNLIILPGGRKVALRSDRYEDLLEAFRRKSEELDPDLHEPDRIDIENARPVQAHIYPAGEEKDTEPEEREREIELEAEDKPDPPSDRAEDERYEAAKQAWMDSLRQVLSATRERQEDPPPDPEPDMPEPEPRRPRRIFRMQDLGRVRGAGKLAAAIESAEEEEEEEEIPELGDLLSEDSAVLEEEEGDEEKRRFRITLPWALLALNIVTLAALVLVILGVIPIGILSGTGA